MRLRRLRGRPDEALAANAVTLTGIVGAAGMAAIVRDSATSIGPGLLYLLPVLSQAIGDPHWERLLQRIGPMTGGALLRTRDA